MLKGRKNGLRKEKLNDGRMKERKKGRTARKEEIIGKMEGGREGMREGKKGK